MNKQLTSPEVQAYIREQLDADVPKLAMARSPFAAVSSQELSGQIAARKKCMRKLPTWFQTEGIYYPPLLSVEQCSSEVTAAYKASLLSGGKLVDLTGGFGVDSYYFSRHMQQVIHCEQHPELSAIAGYNAGVLQQHNTRFIQGDGLEWLLNSDQEFDCIYLDPARRGNAGKVFMLKDCSPNVIAHMDLLRRKTRRIMIKTAPLLDITAGLKELPQVSEIHIVSVKNECKELLWIIDTEAAQVPAKVVCMALNATQKSFSFLAGEEATPSIAGDIRPGMYLYEPDVALLKSGAFNLTGKRYQLDKLHAQTQLYTSESLKPEFPGRIFRIDRLMTAGSFKKENPGVGNVIVRNYPEKAANLAGRYRLKADDHRFLVFTQSQQLGKIVIGATILQHY